MAIIPASPSPRHQIESWFQAMSKQIDEEYWMCGDSRGYTEALALLQHEYAGRIHMIDERERYQARVKSVRGYVDANDYYPAVGLAFPTIGSPSDTGKEFTAQLDKLEKVEPRKVMPKIPDFVQPIVGYRCWKVSPTSKAGRLLAIGVTKEWPAGKPIQATNRGCTKSHSDIPGLNCECGMWAFKTLADLKDAISEYTHMDLVAGQVYLWGRVIECEFGFRAEYAYPKEIWCLKPEHERLGIQYNVPVRMLA